MLALLLVACGAASHGRTGYVVTAKDDTPAGRAALGRAIGATDDVAGDGVVVRLDDAGRARIAAMSAVAAVVPLAAAAKLGNLPSGGRVDVRIDLYEDADAAEVDAVALWIASHGGSVTSRGVRTIDATIDRATAADAASLAAVRWIEPR